MIMTQDIKTAGISIFNITKENPVTAPVMTVFITVLDEAPPDAAVSVKSSGSETPIRDVMVVTASAHISYIS